LLCYFLPSPITFSLLDPTLFLSTLFLNTLSICTTLHVKDQISHTYKTTGKIIALYTLIFMFTDTKQEAKRLCAEFLHASNFDPPVPFPDMWTLLPLKEFTSYLYVIILFHFVFVTCTPAHTHKMSSTTVYTETHNNIYHTFKHPPPSLLIQHNLKVNFKVMQHRGKNHISLLAVTVKWGNMVRNFKVMKHREKTICHYLL
jgi:hypothetical protein